MSDPVHVIVEALPSDHMSLYVSIVSGVVVPILLLGITWFLSNRAEKRAISHAEQLRRSDRTQYFLENSHFALNNLYKSVQKLRQTNLKRKKHEEWSKQVALNNEKIMAGSSNEAKLMQQDLLKWHLENNLELESQHGITLIDVLSAQARAQHLLTEQITSELDSYIKQICDVSNKPGMITEKMINLFVQEINKITVDVESHPEKCVKP